MPCCSSTSGMAVITLPTSLHSDSGWDGNDPAGNRKEERRMLQDLRYAVRGLIKQPAFSLVVIVTLALGIGANTAIFSVVHAVLLSPLPYGEPHRLVVLTAKNQKRNQTKQPMAYLNLVDWQAQNHVFEHLAAIRGESFSLTYLGEPERVNGLRVSVNILS